MANEPAKKVAEQFEAVNAWVNVVEVQMSTAEAQKTKLEITTFIQINCLKSDLFDANKVVDIN